MVAAAGGQRDLPPRSEAPRREAERDVLEVRVEEEQERVVAYVLAGLRLGPQLFAVQEDADRPRFEVVPVATRHAAAVRAHPPDIGKLLAPAFEEFRAHEHRVRAPQDDQLAREREELGVAL